MTEAQRIDRLHAALKEAKHYAMGCPAMSRADLERTLKLVRKVLVWIDCKDEDLDDAFANVYADFSHALRREFEV